MDPEARAAKVHHAEVEMALVLLPLPLLSPSGQGQCGPVVSPTSLQRSGHLGALHLHTWTRAARRPGVWEGWWPGPGWEEPAAASASPHPPGLTWDLGLKPGRERAPESAGLRA